MTRGERQGVDGRLGQQGAAEVGVEDGAGRVDDADQAALAVVPHAPLDPREDVVIVELGVRHRGSLRDLPPQVCHDVTAQACARTSRPTLAIQAVARACDSSRSTDGRSLSEAFACVMLDEAGTVGAGFQPRAG